MRQILFQKQIFRDGFSAFTRNNYLLTKLERQIFRETMVSPLFNGDISVQHIILSMGQAFCFHGNLNINNINHCSYKHIPQWWSSKQNDKALQNFDKDGKWCGKQESQGFWLSFQKILQSERAGKPPEISGPSHFCILHKKRSFLNFLFVIHVYKENTFEIITKLLTSQCIPSSQSLHYFTADYHKVSSGNFRFSSLST